MTPAAARTAAWAKTRLSAEFDSYAGWIERCLSDEQIQWWIDKANWCWTCRRTARTHHCRLSADASQNENPQHETAETD